MRWKILIIDDDEDDFIIARNMLREAQGQQYDVHWAPTFEAGRKELISNHYNAVLVDYDLGVHSGIELIREANERGYAAPLILFTGRGSYEVDVEAMNAGATMYLTKMEVNPLLLERAIRYSVERKQTEEAIRQLEDKFSRAFEFNPAALTIIRISDGFFTDANVSFCHLVGYSRDEIIGRSPVDLNILLLEMGEKILQQFELKGAVHNDEILITAKNGEQRTVLFSLEPVKVMNEPSILATLMDITERKQAEDALRESERQKLEMASLVEADRNRLATVLDSLPVGVWITDRDGRIVDKNDQADRIWAGDAPLVESAIEYHEYQTWNAQTGEPLKTEEFPLAVTLRTGQPVQPVEHRIQRFDGSEGYVLVSATPILDEEGQMMGAVAINLDISERKRAEETIRLSEAAMDAFFETSPGILNLFDADLRYIKTDPITPIYFGLDSQSIIGQSVWDLNPQFAENFLGPMLERVTKTGQPELNLEVLDPVPSQGGKMGYWRISYFPVPLPGGKVGLGVMGIDITEGKRLEKDRARLMEEIQQEKIEAQQRAVELKAIINALHDPVLVYNQEGIIYLANTSAVEAHGFDINLNHRDDSNKALMVRFPDGRVAISDELPSARALRGESIIEEHLEITNRLKQTLNLLVTSKPLIVNGVQVGAVSVWHDITERKKVEEALRLSEERFYRAFNANPNAQVISRMTDGYIESINEGFERLFGYQRDEVLGKTSLELNMFAHPADREEAVRRVREHKFVRDFELDIRTKTGEIRRASLSAELIPINGHTLMLTVIQDITKRKKVEEELLLSEERYRVAVINAPAIYAQTDRELRYKWIYNPQSDFNPQAVIGKRDDELEDSEDARRLVARKQQVLDRGVGLREELVFHHSDGIHTYDMTIEPLRDQDGQIVGVTTAAFDITDLKRTEEALRESGGVLKEANDRFRQLADAMPQLVWTARSDGAVDYYNQRHREYDGIALVEENLWQWGPVLHPDDMQPTMDAWNKAVETGEVYQIEHRVRMADGTFCWHLSRGIPVKDDEGNIIRWYGTATNIHMQKEIEEKLRQSNQDLEQFAFVASHDLQEPLRKIRQFGNAIHQKLKGTLEPETQDNFHRMMLASNRMQNMIQDLLELSRVNTLAQPFEKVDLAAVAAEVLSDLEPRIQRAKGKVVVEDLPTIDADPIQMHQVLQNLIGNALKFHQPEVPPVVKVSSVMVNSPDRKGEMVSIQVQDNGIGFDEGQFEKILQPFQRLNGRNDYEGTGMGLAIVKKIVDRHLGQMSARSAPGEGATFIITLPVKQEI